MNAYHIRYMVCNLKRALRANVCAYVFDLLRWNNSLFAFFTEKIRGLRGWMSALGTSHEEKCPDVLFMLT